MIPQLIFLILIQLSLIVITILDFMHKSCVIIFINLDFIIFVCLMDTNMCPIPNKKKGHFIK